MGRLIFTGRGAGSSPTTSAVLSDILRVAREEPGMLTAPRPRRAPPRLRPMSEVRGRHYLRLQLADHPDAVHQVITSIAGRGVAIERFERLADAGPAAWSEYIVLTGPSTEREVQRAAMDAEGRTLVGGVKALVRVLDAD